MLEADPSPSGRRESYQKSESSAQAVVVLSCRRGDCVPVGEERRSRRVRAVSLLVRLLLRLGLALASLENLQERVEKRVDARITVCKAVALAG